MKKSSTTMGRKILACACSAALGAALVPAAALAAGGESGGSASEEPVVLQVKMQDQQTGQVISLKKKQYTQSQLDSMAAVNTERVSIVAQPSGGRVYSSTKYVTIDQILSGIDKWGDGSSLTLSDGTGGEKSSSTVSYSTLNETGYFFPDYAKGDAKNDSNKIVVKPAIALEGSSYDIGSSTASSALSAIVAGKGTTDSRMRFYMGSPTTEPLTPGRVLTHSITTVTVVYPHEKFQIVAKNAETGATTSIASYNDAELAELAKQNTKPMNFILGSGVYSATKYVTVKQLLGNSKYWKAGSTAAFTAADGFSYTLSYADANAKQYFYPEYSNKEASDNNQVEVEPILAIEGKAGSLGGDGTAENALGTLTTDTGMPRFFKGNTDVKSLLMGKTSPQVLVSITVTYRPEKAPVAPKATGIAKGKSAVAGSGAAKAAYKVTSNKSNTVTYVASKVKKNAKSITVPATVKINGKTYKVTGIAKNAFKGKKAKTVTIKTTKLAKKSVKGCLKGSNKVKTIKIAVSKSKKTNKKYVTKYKKIFTKANAGKKVTVKK